MIEENKKNEIKENPDLICYPVGLSPKENKRFTIQIELGVSLFIVAVFVLGIILK